MTSFNLDDSIRNSNTASDRNRHRDHPIRGGVQLQAKGQAQGDVRLMAQEGHHRTPGHRLQGQPDLRLGRW